MPDPFKAQMSSHFYDIASLALLILAAATMFGTFLPLELSTFDMRLFFVPWMTEVQRNGIASISGEFSDYTPPYVYLMYLASKVAPTATPAIAVKLIPIPFVALMATGMYFIIRQLTEDHRRAILAAGTILVTPTVQVNAFLWGQADTVYTCFLLLFVVFACRGAPLLAVVMFGIALSFKFQAVFLAPFLLYLILSGQVRGWTLLLIPVVYTLLMLPAALAGRPWADLFTVYIGQGNALKALSQSAPNPWLLIQRWDLVSYRTGVLVGLPLAAMVGLAITLSALKLRSLAGNNLLVATTCAAIMPYVLPKMHERYFFVADVLSLALAFAQPRYWLAALLFQIGSLAAYVSYFTGALRGQYLGALAVTLAIGVILLAYAEAEKPWRLSVGMLLRRVGEGFRLRSSNPTT